MTMTFLTDDQWAQIKGYANFNTFIATETYPPAATLDMLRRRAYAILLTYIGAGSPNTTDYADRYMDLEFRMVEMMIDEEEARNNNLPRPQFIPRDYVSTRDREWLSGSDDDVPIGVTS